MPPVRVPLVFVRGQLLVRPAGPRRWTALVESPQQTVDRIRAMGPTEGYVYIYDVDGVEAGAPSHDLYQRLERAHVPLWLHLGCRTPEDAMDAFFAGAEALTIERRHMDDEALHELAELTEGEIHLMFAFQGRSLRPELRGFQLQRLVQEHRLSGIVFQPEASSDGHALNAYAGEVRRHGVTTSLFVAPGGSALDPEPDAFDRVIGGGHP